MIKTLPIIPNMKDRYTQNIEGAYLPYKLISEAHSKEWLRSLAVFVALKKCHRNGIFYNFSSRKIAGLVGYSHQSINKHIKVLEEMGLLYQRNGKNNAPQLVLRGYNHFVKRWGYRVVFIKHGAKQHVFTNLLVQITINNIKSQEFKIRRNASRRNQKLKQTVETLNNYASLSDRYLAEILDVSATTANRLKKEWVKNGYISLIPIWQILRTYVSESDFLNARKYEGIPIYSKYERKTRRILLRKADGVIIETRREFKTAVKSIKPFLSCTGTIINTPRADENLELKTVVNQ